MEIAICLAIIGFALVAIIGVLPYGMNTQRDNREETVISQDATTFLEAIRNGALGADYLTNYVFAIVNTWTPYDSSGQPGTPGTSIYTISNAIVNGPYPGAPLTNGANIISVLSTPEFTDGTGAPIPNLNFGGISNHVVAYVRSISGPAAEKPPQTNAIMLEDTLSYRLLVVNAPMPIDTNTIQQMLWRPQQSQSYTNGSRVFFPASYPLLCWRWSPSDPTANPSSSDVPGGSNSWVSAQFYPMVLALNQRELRLSFFWPLLPNGSIGYGRQTYRTTIAGQLASVKISSGQLLYFYVPQTFLNTP